MSWIWVALWAMTIFATIPVGRALQEYVRDQWGMHTFTYLVMIAIIIWLSVAAIYLIRRRATLTRHYIWLTLIAGVFIFYTYQLKESPEEALHFVEYGMLGILIYRALSHRIRDHMIYVLAALIGAIIGTIDELIQWITPRRYWDYRDIWFNFFAVALVQMGIAKGLEPELISTPVRLKSIRLAMRLSLIVLILLGTSLLNTPERVTRYVEFAPALTFLKDNPSTMNEFGYRYDDSEIGIFRSRLPPDELRQQDRERGAQAAGILDATKSATEYQRFLQQYPPLKDPFLHEARIHLYRRDSYLHAASTHKHEQEAFAEDITIAYREHRIMEKYYPNTLRMSDYVLPAKTIESMAEQQLPDYDYDSRVSQHLITLVSERQALIALLIAVLVLIMMDWYIGRRISYGKRGYSHDSSVAE